GRVLPLALAAHQQDGQPRAQPVQVVAVQVRHVVDRVVEVDRVVALTPAVPGGHVVVAGEAQREGEEVGALEREVQRVEGAHRRAKCVDLGGGRIVKKKKRDNLVDDRRLVPDVRPGYLI